MVELTLETAAVGIVGLAALNLAFRAVSHIFKTYLRPGKNLKRYGKWAVVTGATGTWEKIYHQSRVPGLEMY